MGAREIKADLKVALETAVKENCIEPKYADTVLNILSETIDQCGSFLEDAHVKKLEKMCKALDEAAQSDNEKKAYEIVQEHLKYLEDEGLIEFHLKSTSELPQNIKNIDTDGKWVILRYPQPFELPHFFQYSANHAENIDYIKFAKGMFSLPPASLQYQISSLADRLADKTLGVAFLTSKKHVYTSGQTHYANVRRGELSMHLARTPGLIDPADYAEREKRPMFDQMINRCPYLNYYCYKEGTLDFIRQVVNQKGKNQAVTWMGDHLDKFLVNPNLGLKVISSPPPFTSKWRNISIFTEKKIIYSMRLGASKDGGKEISAALWISKDFIGKVLSNIVNWEVLFSLDFEGFRDQVGQGDDWLVDPNIEKKPSGRETVAKLVEMAGL